MSYVVLLLTVGVTIYALVDCWNSADDEVRGLPRLAWLLVMPLFPLVGAIAYLIYGKQRHQPVGGLGRPRVVAPDDDPEFLRQLDVQRRRALADEKRREQQLKRERKERERRQHDREPQSDPE